MESSVHVAHVVPALTSNPQGTSAEDAPPQPTDPAVSVRLTPRVTSKTANASCGRKVAPSYENGTIGTWASWHHGWTQVVKPGRQMVIKRSKGERNMNMDCVA